MNSVVAGGRRLTAHDLQDLAARMAGNLVRRGVTPGDVVSSQLPNGVEAVALYHAVHHIGAVHNPIVPIYGRREVEFIVNQANTAVFVDPDTANELAEGEPAAVPRRPHPGDVAFLLYTSGTTAEPKGVRHTNASMAHECRVMASFYGLTAGDVFVIPSPVAHVSGLIYGMLVPSLLGATAVLVDRWDPGEFLALVERERGTFCAGATPFLQGAVDHPNLDRYDVSSLRLFPCGGAGVPPDLVRRAIDRLGVRTGRGYGLTEFPSITSSAGPDEPIERRAETDGRPLPGNEVKVVDGEVRARGTELFAGYQDPALDADAFDEEGFFRTGDLGVIDRDGYLTITGRLKDIVIRGGEKFSAKEVEDLLYEHPKVASAAVVPMPDRRLGERACAFVVPRPAGEAPTLEELTDFLAARAISRRKLPERLEIVDHLPVTASGKVQKHLLIARITAMLEQEERP